MGDPFGDATAGPRPSRAPAHAARADDPFEAPAPAPAAALDAFLPAAARSDGELRPDLRTDLSELLDDAPAPPAAAPPSPADALSLEERTTPAPSPLRRAGLDAALAIADPFAAAGPDASEKEPTFWEVLPDPPVPRPPRVAAVAVSAPGRERGERGPAVALAPAARRADAPREGAEERPRPRAPSWLRSIAANALSLAVLLAVAIGLLAVWRGGVAAAALRPAALLAAVVGGDAGPFRATSVSNGFYERARGAPLLFVRGRVVSSAPAAVEGVKVSVEIVRGGAVLARGEAWAGALPSPEELWSARDGAAPQGDAVPHALAPGQALPFVVAVPDAPPEVEGAEVRIALRAQPYSGRGARR